MVVDDPGAAYPDINSVWKKFMDYFTKVEGLMLYAPVFEDYLWEGLRQFREDNVQYLEIRVLLPKVGGHHLHVCLCRRACVCVYVCLYACMLMCVHVCICVCVYMVYTLGLRGYREI